MDNRYDVPLYTIGEAARHLKVSPETLRRWSKRDELLDVVPGRRNHPSLPFISMVQAQIYRTLRSEGLSMQAISEGMRTVRESLGREMLRKGVLGHDGKDILMNLGDGAAAAAWTRARDRQGGIPGIIERVMSPITFGSDDLPTRLRLTAYEYAEVIIDPRFAFGQPIEASSGVRAGDIVQLFSAGEPIDTVAEEFEVEPSIVQSILRVHLGQAA